MDHVEDISVEHFDLPLCGSIVLPASRKDGPQGRHQPLFLSIGLLPGPLAVV